MGNVLKQEKAIKKEHTTRIKNFEEIFVFPSNNRIAILNTLSHLFSHFTFFGKYSKLDNLDYLQACVQTNPSIDCLWDCEILYKREFAYI